MVENNDSNSISMIVLLDKRLNTITKAIQVKYDLNKPDAVIKILNLFADSEEGQQILKIMEQER